MPETVQPVPVVAPPPDDYDAFAHEPPFQGQRNPARLRTILAIVAFLVMVAAIGAISWFGMPTLNGASLKKGSQALTIQVTRKPDRSKLESGNELIAISGHIANPTDETQRVPPIRGDLFDAQGRVVYSWHILPPVEQLGPKQSATFNSAVVDVPRSAQAFNVVFDSPR